MAHCAGDWMTARERVEAVFSFEEPDRVPVYDLLRNDGAIEYYAGEKLTYQNAPEVVTRAIGRALDMTRSIVWPQREGVYTDEQGFVHEQQRWTTWIKERPFATVEELAKFAEGEIKRLSAWQPDREFREQFRETFLAIQRRVGDTVILLDQSPVGLDRVHRLSGLELFSYLSADYPDLLSEWLEALNLAEVRKVHAIADRALSPVALVYADIAYKGKLIYSPKFLRKEFFFRLKRLCDAYHEHGIWCLFHSDGNLMEIMDDLVAAGIDGINPIETAAGMSLAEVKEKYGRRLVLAGGIDCSELLPRGSEEEVRAAVIEAIRIAAPGSGFCLGSTSELHNAIPARNIIAMIDTARQYGRYPLQL